MSFLRTVTMSNSPVVEVSHGSGKDRNSNIGIKKMDLTSRAASLWSGVSQRKGNRLGQESGRVCEVKMISVIN